MSEEPNIPSPEEVTLEESTPAVKKKAAKHPILNVILYVVFGLLFTVGVALFSLAAWYRDTFDLEFKDLLYTLASPLQGTGSETFNEILAAILPPTLIFVGLYILSACLLDLLLRPRRPRLTTRLKHGGALLCAASLIFSAVYAVFAFRIPRYIQISSGETGFYEEHYIHPADVMSTDGKTKNLIYIYLESMETTYADPELQDGNNYMPLLTQLAAEHVSFTEHEDGSLGGFHTPLGTGWTIAALTATASGIPYSFPVGHNGMSKERIFASGLTNLGDILEAAGYNQEFLCGSDVGFGGRDIYYEQHGDYRLFDLYTARDEGFISSDYYNDFWGYEDYILFDIAKSELTRMAAEDAPFNLTLLTVDAHHVGGYVCKVCGNDYTSPTANVISCTDRLVTEFVAWCMEQDFFEDTAIVITGDHPRMDTRLVKGVDYYERTMYNCFINAAVAPAADATVGRTWTSFDVFPTTLAALGFTVEGDYLALGVNMFSGKPTLAETLGYDYLEIETNKFSAFYINEFCPELADRITETEAPETKESDAQ